MAGSLATGGADQMVRLWDVATRQQTEQLQGHGGEVMSVAFSADGQTLASGSKDKTAMLWSVHPNRAVTTVSNVTSRPIFSPDGRLVAAGIGQNKVAVWDVATLQVKAVFAGAHDAVAFSSDGSALMTQGTNYFLRTFDVATQTVSRDDSGPAGGRDLFLRCAVAGWPNPGDRLDRWNAHVFRCENGRRDGTDATRLRSSIFQLAFSPNGKLLATAGSARRNRERRRRKIWDVATRQNGGAPPGHTDLVLDVAFSPDGKTLVDVRRGRLDQILGHHHLEGNSSVPWAKGIRERCCSFSGRKNARHSLFRWHDETLERCHPPRGGLSRLGLYGLYITFSPDGQTLAAQDAERLTPPLAGARHLDKKESRPRDG